MKLWNYIFLITGISVLMALAGIRVPGFTDLFRIMGLTVSSEGIGDVVIQSTFWNFIFGTGGLLVAAIVTGGIGVGTFIYTKDKSFLMIPVITEVLIYWISVLISIINYSKETPIFGILIALIFIPLSIGFIMSCVDYFLGVD